MSVTDIWKTTVLFIWFHLHISYPKQPEVELAPADETSSTDVAVTKEPSTDDIEVVDDLALPVTTPMSMQVTCIEPTEEDWETETTDVPQPSGEKDPEVTPPAEPFVTASETCVKTTEDWDAEASDVPEQVQERDQLDEWVILESAQANVVEPGEVEKVDVDTASVCKVDEPKEKEVPEMKTTTAAEQLNIGEEEACDSEGQLALTTEKVDANKVEEKRGQLPLKTEEEKEEGEITSDDEPTVNVNEGGHTEQEGVFGSLPVYLYVQTYVLECQNLQLTIAVFGECPQTFLQIKHALSAYKLHSVLQYIFLGSQR